MRILIGGGIGGCDWKSWEVWKQCERRRPSYGFTRHQSIPSLGVPFAGDSLIHENYITCGQIQSRSEDFTCKHHLLALQARSPKSCVRRRESNLQIRSDSPKAPSKDFSSRIHCLAATFSRPDTHSDPDANPCQTSGRGDVDGQIFNFFVEIWWTRRLNKIVLCISGSCWKPIRTLQFEAQELSSAPLHCCPSISVFVNYAPTMLSFIICFCHRAILATFDDQVLCKVNWQERTWAIFIMRNVDRNGGTRFRW